MQNTRKRSFCSDETDADSKRMKYDKVRIYDIESKLMEIHKFIEYINKIQNHSVMNAMHITELWNKTYYFYSHENFNEAISTLTILESFIEQHFYSSKQEYLRKNSELIKEYSQKNHELIQEHERLKMEQKIEIYKLITCAEQIIIHTKTAWMYMDKLMLIKQKYNENKCDEAVQLAHEISNVLNNFLNKS